MKGQDFIMVKNEQNDQIIFNFWREPGPKMVKVCLGAAKFSLLTYNATLLSYFGFLCLGKGFSSLLAWRFMMKWIWTSKMKNLSKSKSLYDTGKARWRSKLQYDKWNKVRPYCK